MKAAPTAARRLGRQLYMVRTSLRRLKSHPVSLSALVAGRTRTVARRGILTVGDDYRRRRYDGAELRSRLNVDGLRHDGNTKRLKGNRYLFCGGTNSRTSLRQGCKLANLSNRDNIQQIGVAKRGKLMVTYFFPFSATTLVRTLQ